MVIQLLHSHYLLYVCAHEKQGLSHNELTVRVCNMHHKRTVQIAHFQSKLSVTYTPFSRGHTYILSMHKCLHKTHNCAYLRLPLFKMCA